MSPGVDPDEKLRGINVNVPSAPWNLVRAAAVQRYDGLFSLLSEEALSLPFERWRVFPVEPVFPDGFVEQLARLVEGGSRIAIVADSQTGKSVLQLAVHRALSVPNALAVHDAFVRFGGEFGPLTSTFTLAAAPEELSTDVRVASWHEFLICGHLFRLFHDAPTICTTGREKRLARYWLAGRGGTVTIPNPVQTVGEAYFDLAQCFPFVAALTTHIVTIHWSGRDAHVYRLYEAEKVAV